MSPFLKVTHPDVAQCRVTYLLFRERITRLQLAGVAVLTALQA
jgi:hypothetical protein